jgi:hypothetical protein
MRESTGFKTTWTSGSGNLPTNLTEEYCREKALEHMQSARLKAEAWTAENFELKLNSFIKQFDEGFFHRLDFLIWYQGKDFQTALSRRLNNFSINSYYKFVKKHFDHTRFSDLVELKKLVVNNL